MKKFSVTLGLMTFAIALTPAAFANSLTFDHDSNSLTFISNDPADQGTVTVTDFAYIEDTSETKDLTIEGFEFYFGGSVVSGAAGDTPSQFQSAENGWTYSIGEGDLTSMKGSGWSKNNHPDTIGGAVKPIDSSQKDYIGSVSVVNNSQSGYCYTGEVLDPDQFCQVELDLTINYGGAMGSSSNTFIYGFADGKLSGQGANSQNDSQFQGMQEKIDIMVATPEPDSLILLGTGFGLLGLAAFFRRNAAARAAIG